MPEGGVREGAHYEVVSEYARGREVSISGGGEGARARGLDKALKWGCGLSLWVGGVNMVVDLGTMVFYFG